jgi:hypothetical protein
LRASGFSQASPTSSARAGGHLAGDRRDLLDPQVVRGADPDGVDPGVPRELGRVGVHPGVAHAKAPCQRRELLGGLGVAAGDGGDVGAANRLPAQDVEAGDEP